MDAFKRALDAFNRRDFDAVLEQLDPEAEWHPGVQASLEGETTTFRGREAVRKGLQGLVDAFADLRLEVSEVRDLGDRVLATGRLRAHGTESGVEIESPWAYLVEYKSGKAVWVRAFLNPREALEAAGLQE